VEQLSKDLRTEFPGVRGFSARNIWNMKRFYEFYSELLISATTVAEIEIPHPLGAEIKIMSETTNSAPKGAELSTHTKSIYYNYADASAELQIAEYEKLQPMAAELPPPLVAEVGWEQNCIILTK
jgi:hypothetical protein